MRIDRLSARPNIVMFPLRGHDEAESDPDIGEENDDDTGTPDDPLRALAERRRRRRAAFRGQSGDGVRRRRGPGLRYAFRLAPAGGRSPGPAGGGGSTGAR